MRLSVPGPVMILLALTLLQDLAVAQETSALLGKKVFVKEAAVVVPVEGELKDVSRFVPHAVVAEEAERVRVRNVWVRKADLMTLAEARAVFQKQVDHDPTVANAWFALGQCAAEFLESEEAIRLKADSAEFMSARGFAKLSMKDIAGASKDFENALRIDPKEWRAMHGVGAIKAIQKDHKGALAELDRAISIEQGTASLYSHRSSVKGWLGDYDGAVVDSTESLRLEPFTLGVIKWRSEILTHLNRNEEALADINQWLLLDPKNANAWAVRGVLKCRLNDKKNALLAMDRAIQIEPKNVYALTNRGRLKLEMKDAKGAIRDFDILIELSRVEATIFMERASAYYLLGELDRASADIQEAAALEPQNLQYVLSRGVIAVELKKFSVGIKDLDLVISQGEKSFDAWHNRGLAKLGIFDFENAIKDFDEAVKLNGRDARPIYNRGLAKFELGDRLGAKEDLDRAARMTPRTFGLRNTSKTVTTEVSSPDKVGFHFSFAISTSDPSRVKELVTKAAGQLYLKQNDWAQENAGKALETEPENLNALKIKSAAQFAKKDYQGVIATQEELLKIVPGDPTQIQNRGIAKMLAGDFEGAVSDSNLVIEKRTKSAPAYSKRGYAKLLLKDYEGAIRDFDKASQLDGEYLEPIYLKAILLTSCDDAAIRNVALARSLYEKANTKAPDSSYTLTAQACILAMEGKYKEAISAQEKAMQDKPYLEDVRIQGGAKAAERIAAWNEEKVWTIRR